MLKKILKYVKAYTKLMVFSGSIDEYAESKKRIKNNIKTTKREKSK